MFLSFYSIYLVVLWFPMELNHLFFLKYTLHFPLSIVLLIQLSPQSCTPISICENAHQVMHQS